MTNEIPNKIVELPSKGECYPHKKGEVAVSYLTAMDENLIISKRLHKNEKAIDTLLERKILDKDFHVENLCVGDRNAIILWLAQTGYGNEYNNNGTMMDLSTITYNDFHYFADENGLFDYQMANGDILKYRLMTHKDEKEVLSSLGDEETGEIDLSKFTNELRQLLLQHQTVSVNGNNDVGYVNEYISNMDSLDLMKYLRFMNFNTPRVDANIDFEELLCDKIKEDIFSEEWI